MVQTVAQTPETEEEIEAETEAEREIDIEAEHRMEETNADSKNAMQSPCGPLRIDTPRTMNCPKRMEGIKAPLTKVHQEQISDFGVLTEACRRAGKFQGEGTAHFGMGVIFDNAEMYEKAIECYQKHLAISIELGDQEGEALAYNHIGVDCHLLGHEYHSQALHCYAHHLSKADVAGRFAAHTNIGILYNSQGNYKPAALNHQHALKAATQLGDERKQAIAASNLGITGYLQKDYVTATACMERYLRISTQIHDTIEQAKAFQNLGIICSEEEKHEDARAYFQHAIKIAQSVGKSELVSNCLVSLGVIEGKIKYESYMAEVQGTMRI
eukprot:TRINITY_DN5445_c0_g1_i1.p1 TRINITY_DN5445_c0_g1~~TRINITY_DN5445_c0_g1_i1.p1  ORF type:complete len:350 (-),score=80.57 TRINITY_DN5445_c0_g1_i1:100-1080(-)